MSQLSFEEQQVILFHKEFVEILRSKGLLMTQEVADNGNLIARSAQVGANIDSWINVETSHAYFSVEVGRDNTEPITWSISAERVGNFSAYELAIEVRLKFLTI